MEVKNKLLVRSAYSLRSGVERLFVVESPTVCARSVEVMPKFPVSVASDWNERRHSVARHVERQGLCM
jgi:hypothetical protein